MTQAEATEKLLGQHKIIPVIALNNADHASPRRWCSVRRVPGFNPKVVLHCQEINLPICPGIGNLTSIEMALDHGLKAVKLFPRNRLAA